MLSGIYHFRENSNELAEKANVLAKSSMYGNLNEINTLFLAKQLCISEISSSEKVNANVITISSDESITWFMDLSGIHVSDKSNVVSILRKHNWDRLPNLPGNWMAIYWNKESSILRLASDFLGSVWLYIVQYKDGYAFSQNYCAIKKFAGKDLILDLENALLELVLGYIPDDSTLYKNIRIAPASSVIELREEGIRVIYQKLPEYSDKYFGLSQDEKFQCLDKLFEEIFYTSILPGIEDTCISLSAGLDSRYALALMNSYGVSCKAYTFGLEDSVEVSDARKVASRAGMDTTLFTFRTSSWDVWQDEIKRLGNTGQIQLAGWSHEWFSLLAERHKFVLHGYIGDALSGKHLNTRAINDTESWLDAWVNWSLFGWASSELLMAPWANQIRIILKNRMAKVIQNINCASPHQLVMHLDFFGRQRRWVASQANIISDYLGAKTFFCNAEMQDFWTNIPYSDLQNQKLYRDYAYSRFPKFFTNDEQNFTIKLVSKVRNRIQRLSRNYTIPKSYPIDREKIFFQNVDNIIELSRLSENELSELVDFPRFNSCLLTHRKKRSITQEEAGIILRSVNLMFLVM